MYSNIPLRPFFHDVLSAIFVSSKKPDTVDLIRAICDENSTKVENEGILLHLNSGCIDYTVKYAKYKKYNLAL